MEFRTAQQIQADSDMEVAIDNLLTAYGRKQQGCTVSDYVVIVAQQGFTDENSGKTWYDYLLARGQMPWHVIRGLMEWARDTAREQMAGHWMIDGEEDEGTTS